MRKFRKPLLPLLLMIFGLSCAVPTVAWFINDVTVAEESISGGSIFNYYARGKGTAEDPYILTKPKHVYNFAWLQNRGTYTTKTYFKLGNDIDMAGYLNGTTSESGAIPPIGTTSNPFIGDFDGNGKTISNLWVSSDSNDWKETPKDSTISIGTDIGFFGAMSASGTGSSQIIGRATNFYLENIEVTCHVNDANVGVVCGYLNRNLKNVGVKNGKISLKSVSKSYSRFSLVGKTSGDVDISEVPTDKAGGDLVINPTVSDPGSVGNGSKIQVPNSAQGRAYYIGVLSTATPKPCLSATAVRKNGAIDYTTASNSYSSNPTDMQLSSNGSGITDTDAYNAIRSENKKMIKFNSDPNFTVSGANDYPKNCVWFKPLQGGTVALAFCRQNNSNDESMSLYRYSRLANGKIDADSIKETKFTLLKQNSVVGNGGNVYFEVTLDKNEAYGYEFAIANSRNNTGSSAGFVYMKLAGANIDGGGVESETHMALDKVDFVKNTSVNLMTFTVHNSNLMFDINSTSSSYSLYYNALESDDKTHYYSTPDVIVEKITGTTSNPLGSVKDTSASNFPSRSVIKPQQQQNP